MNLLTGIPETDMLIMSRLNTNTLENICMISKDAYKICMNPYFWQLKFDYAKLPILEQQYNIGEWIDLYEITEIMVNNIKLVLDIHYIEATRKHDPLNLIRLPLDYKIQVFNTLNKIKYLIKP